MKGIGTRAFRMVCTPERMEGVEALLRAEGYAFNALEFSRLARELTEEPTPLGSSVAAAFGWIYIQDRSSMLPPLCLDPNPGAPVLDLCASPGGKTGFLAQLVGDGGFVLANEPNPRRLATLRQNLRAMNLVNVASCSHKGETIALKEASWPYILVDAPCSGWGTVDKHPRVTSLWRDDKVEPLLGLQRQLLGRASALLAPGGRLVYSTCTTNVRENEEQVLWAEAELGLARTSLTPLPGFVYDSPEQGASGCLKVRGEGTNAQGFFVACLTRPGEAASLDAETDWRSFPGTPVDEGVLQKVPGAAWDRLPQGRVLTFGDKVVFVPQQGPGLLPEGFVWQGHPLGRMAKGMLRLDPVARVLLPDRAEAGLHVTDIHQIRALLSGQSLILSTPPEHRGLYWQDLPLGWLTVKGRRVLWSGK